MATQGIFSIIGSDGKTIVKCICGCNGHNIDKLKDSIIRKKTCKVEEIYQEAVKNSVGCQDCLVVMDRNTVYSGGLGDELSELYRSTFYDPIFNPRWTRGTADCWTVVSIDYIKE